MCLLIYSITNLDGPQPQQNDDSQNREKERRETSKDNKKVNDVANVAGVKEIGALLLHCINLPLSGTGSV